MMSTSIRMTKNESTPHPLGFNATQIDSAVTQPRWRTKAGGNNDDNGTDDDVSENWISNKYDIIFQGVAPVTYLFSSF